LPDLVAQRLERLRRAVPGIDDERIGQAVLRQAVDDIGEPARLLDFCSAWSRGTKRNRCTRGLRLRRASICATSARLASSAMKALTCGSAAICCDDACRLSITT